MTITPDTTIWYYSEDMAGNVEIPKSYTIKIDNDNPTIGVSPAPSTGWYTAEPTFHFTFDDGRSGVYQHSAESVKVSDTKGTSVTAYVIDKAGNRYDYPAFNVKVDTVPPTTTLTPARAPNAEHWYNGPVNISFTAKDDTSGVDKTSYRLNGGDWQTYKSGAVSVSQEGANVITYYSTDAAGNREEMKTCTIQIDTAKPTITVSPTPSAEWYTTFPTFRFTFTDSTAGVLAHSAEEVTVSADTTGQEVTATATDKAGNTETTKFTVKVDTTAPVSTAALSGAMGNNGWYISNVVLTISAVDSGPAGVGTTEYSTDGTTWIPYTVPITISTDGARTIFYRSIDNAGNTEAAKQISVKVDKTAPILAGSLSGEKSNKGWFSGDASLSISYGDATSGINSLMYSLDGSQWSTYTGPVTVKNGGSHNVYYGAIDNAGNRQNGTSFAYFAPASIQYVWSTISPTATPTVTPTVTPTPSAVATPVVSATPGVTVTPTVAVTPVPTTSEQTQPGNNWWLYLGGVLVLILGGAGAYLLFLRK